MTKIREKDLHRYLDGELSPAETARIRRMAGEDQDLAKRIAGIESLRQALGKHFSEQAASGNDLDVWPQVRVRMQQADKPGWSERIAWFFSWHSRVLGWTVAGAVAAVALVALVFMVGRGPQGPVRQGRVPSRSASPSNRLVVEDYQGPPPTVFEIPGDRGQTTVLWVQPPGEHRDDRDAGAPRSRSPGSI